MEFSARFWKQALPAAALSGFSLLASMGAAKAQDTAANYPNRAVRLIVSAAAGGGNDLIARILAEKLPTKWGQAVIVENRPGGGNNIAAQAVFRSPADGYTMLVSPPAPITINKALFKDLKFDPEKFEPVAVTSYIPNVLLFRPDDARFTDALSFIAFAKGNPGKLNYGSQGNGTTGHLTAALFEMLTGVKHSHVPYGGAAPAMNDLVAGHIDFMFADVGTAIPLVEGGKLRMVATLSKERLALAPQMPTIAEVGLPQLLSDTWTGITAPPETPLDVRQKIAADMREVIMAQDVKERLAKLGVISWGLGPKEAKELIESETRRWTDVIEKANVRLQ